MSIVKPHIKYYFNKRDKWNGKRSHESLVANTIQQNITQLHWLEINYVGCSFVDLNNGTLSDTDARKF